MKHIRIYSISPNYRKVTVWEGSRMTGARLGTHTCTPDKHLTREQRHATIAAWLYREHQIPGPCYNAQG
jgi:hypothetical protein